MVLYFIDSIKIDPQRGFCKWHLQVKTKTYHHDTTSHNYLNKENDLYLVYFLKLCICGMRCCSFIDL